MPLWDDNETIDDLDEAMLLGYFESIKGVFITKWAMLWTLTDVAGEHFVPDQVPEAIVDEVRGLYPYQAAYDALANPANEHLVANFVHDIVTSAIIGTWAVFEQLIKHLPVPNYAHDPRRLSASYNRNIFGLTQAEKENLDLIYYIRNAIVHCNGAYYAEKAIKHSYHGQTFESVGHEGDKIDVEEATAWHIICDVEQYAIKVWQNWTAWRAAHP